LPALLSQEQALGPHGINAKHRYCEHQFQEILHRNCLTNIDLLLYPFMGGNRTKSLLIHKEHCAQYTIYE